MTRHKWWCLMLALTVASSRVWTADQSNVPDPTRPPASVFRSTQPAGMPGMPTSGAQAAAETASVASAPKRRPLPRLTLLRVGKFGMKSVALIDGRAVSLGDRVGELTVASIDTQGVTLRGARGTQRLTLLSAAYQEEAPSAASAASSGEKESP